MFTSPHNHFLASRCGGSQNVLVENILFVDASLASTKVAQVPQNDWQKRFCGNLCLKSYNIFTLSVFCRRKDEIGGGKQIVGPGAHKGFFFKITSQST